MDAILKMTSWSITPLIVMLWFVSAAASEGIIGSRESCANEGEEVSVDSIKDMRCFTCMCKNGFVECQRERCPSQAGCYMLMEEDREQCCQLCKGCWWEGTERPSGSEWTDKEDPCRVFKCLAGVVTETRMICHVPCQHPLPPAPGECCPTCKGCLINGQEIGPERDATIPEDPCLNCHCHSSNASHRSMKCTKIACPVLQCPLPKQYTPSGQCCPVCKGTRLLLPPRNRCFLVQELRVEGEIFSSLVSNPNPSALSSANEKVFSPLGQGVVKKHEELSPGNCTKCICMKNGTVHCLRETCPVLECPVELRVWPIELDAWGNKRKSCCMKCMEEQAAATRQCSHMGKIYKEGERWALDPCRSCVCSSGSVRCAMEMCPPMNAIVTSSKGPRRTPLPSPNIACPPNTRLYHPKGTCCPACVESDGVCSVFGDPHYRTFDGRFYSFQGACKYLLVSDQCGQDGASGTFSIRVTNDARDTFTSSWTKTISIKAFGHKVSLGQRMRVKVNGRRVALPWNLTSNSTQIISVKKEGGGVILWLESGIMVIWDGNSFLEVSVPTVLKNKLCGLCGNYNDDPKDDLYPREGFHFADKGRQRAVHKRYGNNALNLARGNSYGTVAEFASSWRVGGKKACSRGVEEGMPWLPVDWAVVPSMCRSPSEMRRKRKRELYRKCRPLRSALFAACHEKVNPTIYMRSCISDQCECPRGGMCHCPSMKAYAHACRRALQSTLTADPPSPFTLPREIENWRNATGCLEAHLDWGRDRKRQQRRRNWG